MINEKTATLIRQPHSMAPYCPENCDFCPGMGLKDSFVLSPGAVPIMACNYWSSTDADRFSREGETKKTYFVPGKYLVGESFLPRLFLMPKGTRFILLIDSENFSEAVLNRIRKALEIEIWIILKRYQNTNEILRKIQLSYGGWDELYFYSPSYEIDSKIFLTTSELFKKIVWIEKKFEDLTVSLPPGIDLYNHTLDFEDLKFNHSIEFEFSRSVRADISVVIPCFENVDHVEKVLEGLSAQEAKTVGFEVLLVDDGSSQNCVINLVTLLEQKEWPFSLKLIHYFPSRKKVFRAGLARTLGVSYSKGSIYAFLDSDILVPPNYIHSLYENHRNYDVVQIQRIYLKKSASEKISSYVPLNNDKDIFHPDGGYWKDFFQNPEPWEKIPNFWKYTCTYGLSVRAEKFRAVNGFRSIFNSYGFEDTDLGYRLAKSKASFSKSSVIGYHLWHPSSSVESTLSRAILLNVTGKIFFRHTLDPNVYRDLRSFVSEARGVVGKFKSFFSHF